MVVNLDYLQLVTFEQAKALKELGFPQQCYFLSDVYADDGQHYFINLPQTPDCDMWEAPNIEVVAKWLRDEKNLYIKIELEGPDERPIKGYGFYNIIFTDYKSENCKIYYDEKIFATHDEALSRGIDKAITLLQNS